MPRPTFRPGLLALAIALAVPAPFLHAARPNRPACATTASPPGRWQAP